ncbi:hypothetical protein IQ247_29325 [Plectonema cf. radiosum LEGE 06105]|uniref:Uncharacterized protein n=1 Tax=Plectonema cf. radiosum LEGE 06105 TaxID=945769 RepID=A0A8J7F8E8_9CYAN|nr:hypothetical protein [Plectonema cf. radiosum LEGE 06105]
MESRQSAVEKKYFHYPYSLSPYLEVSPYETIDMSSGHAIPTVRSASG